MPVSGTPSPRMHRANSAISSTSVSIVSTSCSVRTGSVRDCVKSRVPSSSFQAAASLPNTESPTTGGAKYVVLMEAIGPDSYSSSTVVASSRSLKPLMRVLNDGHLPRAGPMK